MKVYSLVANTLLSLKSGHRDRTSSRRRHLPNTAFSKSLLFQPIHGIAEVSTDMSDSSKFDMSLSTCFVCFRSQVPLISFQESKATQKSRYWPTRPELQGVNAAQVFRLSGAAPSVDGRNFCNFRKSGFCEHIPAVFSDVFHQVTCRFTSC